MKNGSSQGTAAAVVKIPRGRSVLLSIVGAAIVIAFVYYLYANADHYLGLLKLSVPGLLALLVLDVPGPVLNGLQNTLLYRSLGTPRFSYRDGILIAAASTLANQLPIPGGIVSKAFYLKQKHNLPYSLFLTSTVAFFLCFVSLQGWIGIATLAYLRYIRHVFVSPVLWVGFALMGMCLLVLWIPVDRLRLPGSLRQRLQAAIEGWMIITRDPAMVIKSLVLQVIFVVILALRYKLALGMVSQHVTFSQALLMSNASVLTQLVSLAPGGLGIREAIVGGIASIFGFDMAVSVAAVGLDRLVVTLVIFVIGGLSIIVLGREISAISSEQVDRAPE